MDLPVIVSEIITQTALVKTRQPDWVVVLLSFVGLKCGSRMMLCRYYAM